MFRKKEILWYKRPKQTIFSHVGSGIFYLCFVFRGTAVCSSQMPLYQGSYLAAVKHMYPKILVIWILNHILLFF